MNSLKESSRVRGCNNIILMTASSSRVCWNRLSTASPEGERSDRMNKNQTEKWNAMLFISIKMSWACKVNYPIVVPVSTSRVCWNRSSTASLEGNEIRIGWISSYHNLFASYRQEGPSARPHLFLCPYVPMSVPPSFRPSIRWSFCPHVRMSCSTEDRLINDSEEIEW